MGYCVAVMAAPGVGIENSNELTNEEDELLRGYHDGTRSRYRELSNNSNPLDT